MKRVVSAFLLVPIVVILVLYVPALWFLAAATLLSLFATLELGRFGLAGPGPAAEGPVDAGPPPATGPVAAFFAAATVPVVWRFGPGYFAPMLVLALFCLFAAGIFTDRHGRFRRVAMDAALGGFGLVYIAVPVSYLVLLRGLEKGGWWIMYLLLVIWAADSFAYITGRYLGRSPMSPRVSPKKTWEGAFGGLLFAVFASLIFNRAFALGMDFPEAVVMALVIGVISIIGDLVESVLKRAAGVKDSGSVIPGHGGILDRIDSLLFPIPLLYYFLIWQT